MLTPCYLELIKTHQSRTDHLLLNMILMQTQVKLILKWLVIKKLPLNEFVNLDL